MTHKEYELYLFKTAVQLEGVLKNQSFTLASSMLAEVLSVEHSLQEKKFRIAVVGEFNRGKSSLINVLLEQKILPESILPSTATINRITYGETPKAYVVLKDSKEREEIKVENLSAYVTKLTENSAVTSSKICEAVVEFPTMFCLNDVDFIDTPGMNDDDTMNARTVELLKDIDLAIVALNAALPYSQTENNFVIDLLENSHICQIMFVVTHIDQVDEEERNHYFTFLSSRISKKVYEALEERYSSEDLIYKKYHTVFDNLLLYGVSSVDGMKALKSNDMALYEKSGFLTLKKDLSSIILNSRSISLLENARLLLEGIAQKSLLELQKQKDEGWKKSDELLNIFERKSDDIISCLSSKKNVSEYLYNFSPEIDSKKDMMKESFLEALGTVQETKPETIRAVLIPIQRNEFTQANGFIICEEVAAIKNLYNMIWVPQISELINALKAIMDCQTDICDSSDKMILDFFRVKEDFDEIIQQKTHDIYQNPPFLWIESPTQAIINTNTNHSVLPGLEHAIEISLSNGLNNVLLSAGAIFSELTSELQNRTSCIVNLLKENIQEKKEGKKETEAIENLKRLQKSLNLDS